MERHEDEGWQVKGPPLISSLQDVKPGTAEQSDETAQITKNMQINVQLELYFNNLLYWHIFAAPQYSNGEQSCVQLLDA